MGTIYNFSKYLISKKSNQAAYVQMRNDYIINKNNSIDVCSLMSSVSRPKFSISRSSGVLGDLSKEDVRQITDSINENGFYIFDAKLPEEIIENISQFMETVPIAYRNIGPGPVLVDCDGYRKNRDLSNRFDLTNTQHCNGNEAVLKLITDQNFLHIANEYLNVKPILDIVAIWWNKTIPEQFSPEQKEKLKSASAQMFHHDMDRLKFLKFFIYLTDVEMDSGPHVYVRKTHQKSPDYITADGRYSDEMIDQYAKEDVMHICGKKGSILAVDTRGIHKGLEVNKGERLLFQLEFTNSLFGKPEFPQFNLNLKINPAYKEVYKLFSADKA